MIKQQLHCFFNALAFYSRLPTPHWAHFNDENLNRGSRYFSLVGIIVGALIFAIFYASSYFFPHLVAVLVALLAGIWITGAFHEDGFADLCDGFGGGWEKEDVLRIMKDSRLGTYGTIALFGMLSLKWATLMSIDVSQLFWVLLSAQGMSRAWSISLIKFLPYVQLDAQSKAKPIAKKLHASDLTVCWLIALIPALFLKIEILLMALCVGGLVAAYLVRWFRRRLGGYTGDLLGASQQIQELTFYFICVAMSSV